MRAPAALKIDGKADDWGKFNAYNGATDVFYNLANTDKYVYLIVQTTNYNITNKVIRGGVTLTVNTNADKTGSGTAITFPLAEPEELREIIQAMRDVSDNTDAGQDESLTSIANKKLAAGLKLLKATGFINMSDSLLSVYNEQGIRAAAALSNKNILTCEFEIPIALLNLKGDKFSYNIKLNGPKLRRTVVPVYIPELEDKGAPLHVFRGQGAVSAENMTPQQTAMVASTMSTDFSAEYKLAK